MVNSTFEGIDRYRRRQRKKDAVVKVMIAVALLMFVTLLSAVVTITVMTLQSDAFRSEFAARVAQTMSAWKGILHR